MTSQRASLENPTNRELLALEKRVDGKAPSLSGDLRVHLAYPNQYWVAMSNLGFQAVYDLFSREEGVAIERAFLPEDFKAERHDERSVGDFADRKQPAWKTFESSRPLSDCELLGFSLSFETDYPHLLAMLRNQGLLFRDAAEREDAAQESKFSIPIIIVGGTGVTLNPEPIADFVDVIVLGEAEELIPELVAEYRAARKEGLSRRDTLARLSRIEGVYVPQFYQPKYDREGILEGYDSASDVPVRPARRFVKDLSKFPTYTKILTPETEFRSMFLTETGRGCEMGCRFCVAGYIYRPVRKRSEESIRQSIEIGLEVSDAVGFVGAAVSSHKSISKLATEVAERGARALLSSLMSQKVSTELAVSLSESEYKTVALAPEAGSVRLRRAAGKRVTNDQVVEAARTLAENGIRGFKLYFIVGLPTERDEDVDAIAHLAEAVRNTVMEVSKGDGRAAWVTLSVNPFIPKASTPFQWAPMLDEKLLDRKIERLRKLTKRVNNLEMRFEPPKESYFQALLSRGDRRVGKLLYETEMRGHDWKWLLVQARKRAVPGVPDLASYVTRRFSYDEFLPWDVVDSRIEKSLLRRECERAYASDALQEDVEVCGNSDEPVTAVVSACV